MEFATRVRPSSVRYNLHPPSVPARGSRASEDIPYVERLLRHRRISTAGIYTQVADAALKLRITEKPPRKGLIGTS